mgnify:CR=1 FL=1
MSKPTATSSLAEKELDKAEKQFEAFDEGIKSMTFDRMNLTPKLEEEPQTKISGQDLSKMKDIYLKPHRSISSKEKFNEAFRSDYNFSTEYVQFTAENKEIIGDGLEFWTKPFAGMPAEFWKVPSNKPVWGPRHVAERIKGCRYHRLKMENTISESTATGQFYGSMAVDTTVQRLDAIPVSSRRSIFMGTNNF